MITLGIAAIRSTRLVSTLASGFGARKTMKTESSSDAGTAITSAMTASRTEP